MRLCVSRTSEDAEEWIWNRILREQEEPLDG